VADITALLVIMAQTADLLAQAAAVQAAVLRQVQATVQAQAVVLAVRHRTVDIVVPNLVAYLGQVCTVLALAGIYRSITVTQQMEQQPKPILVLVDKVQTAVQQTVRLAAQVTA
jgi:hypothetical protein